MTGGGAAILAAPLAGRVRRGTAASAAGVARELIRIRTPGGASVDAPRSSVRPPETGMADRAARLERRAAAGGGFVERGEDRDVLSPLGRLDEGGAVLEDRLGHVGQVGAVAAAVDV